MAQFARPTLSAAVDDGITLSTKLNGAFPALYTNHAGAAAPPSPEKGQMWLDTSAEGATPPVLTLKQYTGTVWNVVGSMNLTTGLFTTAGGLPSSGGAVTGPIRFPFGTVAAPSITFEGNQNTGIFRIAANQLGFSTNGVQRLGITTTNFDITLPNFRLMNTSPAIAIDRDSGATGASVLRFRVGTSDRWAFQVTGAESTGDAGSNFFLQSFNDAGALVVNYLQISRASRQMGINGAAIGSGALTVRTNAAAIAEDALELMNTNTDLNGSVGLNFRTAGGGLRGAIRGVRPGNNSGDLQIQTATNGVLALAATFRANGNLDVVGQVNAPRANFSEGVVFGNSGNYLNRVQLGWNVATGSEQMNAAVNGTPVGNVVIAPNIRQFSLTPGLLNMADTGTGFFSINLNPSDRRLKDNIAPSTVDGLADILSIPIVQFDWKPETFGAEAPPQPIGMTTDTLPRDCVNSEGSFESVNLLPLVARLVQAIQQQQKQIDDLRARIEGGNS